MRAIVAIILAGLLVGTNASRSRKSPNDLYRIKLTVQGALVEGSQERAARLVGKTSAEPETILREPLPQLGRGSTFQLSIAITNPSGVTSDYTGSSLLRYEHFGCLSVTPSGVLTVIAARRCSGADKPALWIALFTEGGEPISYNEYLFSVP